MWQMILAKAVNNLQKGIATQDAKRKQAAYSTHADLTIENPAVRFGMSPDEENQPKLLLAPYDINDNGNEEDEYF